MNIGRFIKSKQQALLIRIFSRVNLPNWKLIFIGEGEYREQCVNLIESLSLKDRVEFHDSTKNIAAFYQRASVFAFTSSSEGFPNALAEAMLAGCACISFDCVAGPSDIIQDGKNGFLVPLNNETEFEHKLHQLMKDELLRKSFVTKAKELDVTMGETSIVNAYHQLLIS